MTKKKFFFILNFLSLLLDNHLFLYQHFMAMPFLYNQFYPSLVSPSCPLLNCFTSFYQKIFSVTVLFALITPGFIDIFSLLSLTTAFFIFSSHILLLDITFEPCLIVLFNPILNQLSNSSSYSPHLIHNMIFHSMDIWSNTEAHISHNINSKQNKLISCAKTLY